MKIFKKLVLISGIALLALQPILADNKIPKPGATPIVKLDRIIAIVNNQVITKNQLDEKVSMAKRQMRLSNTPVPSNSKLRDQALKLLITQNLQLQLAKRAGLTVTDSQLEDALNSIAARNKTTLAQMRSALIAQGISYPQFRAEIKNQILTSKVQQAAVGRSITVSPQEIEGMRKQMGSTRPVQYHLADLLIPLPDNPTPADITKAKRQAKNLLIKIKAGKSFKAVAAAESASANAVSGGDLGWKTAAELPSIFVSAVQNRVTNSIVGPIQAPNGFHLLKILGKRRDQDKTISDLQIKQMIWQRKFAENVEVWLQKLRSEAYVKMES